MVFYKILIFCIVFNVFVDFIESIPTFGDEFVHIKVHVPQDPASSHGYMLPKHESESSIHYHTPHHKVIHHYHRRRRPIKKVPKIEEGPLFENVLLAELDNSSNGHISQHEAKNHILPPIEETYVIKEEHHVKPAVPKVNTYTVVEETLRKKPKYNHHYEETHQQPHREYGKENIETFRIIEENKGQQQYQPKNVEQHVETVKIIEEKPYYPQQQHVAKEEHTKYEYHIPQKTKYKTSYEAIPVNEQEEGEDEEENYYPQPQNGQDDYEHYKSQQQEPFKTYHGENYFEKPLKESIEIIKNKRPNKYHYEFENDDAIPEEETQYSKPKDEYYHYRETPEENHHFNKNSPIKSFSSGNLENYETGYHYHSPSTSLQQSSFETHSHQHFIPTVPPEVKTQFKASPSYAQFGERPHYEVSHKYSNDIQLQLPATENPTDFHDSSYNYQPIAAHEMAQNTLYDDLGTSSVYRPGAAEETYTGYDSYSAAHVQGLGSGGYKFPIAYA